MMPTPVTVVIPCYNEADGVGQLVERLHALETQAADCYDFRFLFVDDGSTDRTGETLERACFGWKRASVVHHDENHGITAAILTGLRHADTDIACSLDSDCTYDPLVLAQMIPLLTPDTDLVTASPYHRGGRVENVPAWRLMLSRMASRLYRLLAQQKLATYTSCCRVYRRSTVLALPTVRDGFQGVAELLLRLDHAGGRIIEHPATLHVRKFGQSKLRLVRCIAGHLQVMAWLAVERLRSHARVLESVTQQGWQRERTVA